jgi:hypothetical protein
VGRRPCRPPGRTEPGAPWTRMRASRDRAAGCEPVGTCPGPIQAGDRADDRYVGAGYSRDAALDRAIGLGLGTRVPPGPPGEPGNWGRSSLADRGDSYRRTSTSSIRPSERGSRRSGGSSRDRGPGGPGSVSRDWRIRPADVPAAASGRLGAGGVGHRGDGPGERREPPARPCLEPCIVPVTRGVVVAARASLKRFGTGRPESAGSAAADWR